MNCNFLKEVVYEGFSEDLEINEWAFFMCVHFHKDGREIICTDTPKEMKKAMKPTNLRLERFVVIHKMIKAGGYPNSNDLLNACNDAL